jgi:cytochrome c oxidase subunit II
MHKIFLSGMVATLFLMGAGCAAADQSSTPAPTASETRAPEKPMGMEPQTPPEITDAQKAQVAAGEAKHKPKALTFDFNAGPFYFVPNVIKVKKGDKVTFNMKNDKGFHDLTLDEFGLKIGPLKEGESGTATFTADKAGTFEYYCSVGKHRALGQKGTLIVE